MRKTTLAAAIISVFCTANLHAQKYPSENADGEKVYYKITSAFPEYSQKCVSYQTPKNTATGFYFVIENLEEGNISQEWEIIAETNDDSGKYFLRNRRSLRFISSDAAWKSNILTPNSATMRTATNPFNLEDIDEGQIVINYTDDTGDKRYLYAADTDAPRPSFNKYALENSEWAWKVCTASGTPVSIPDLLKNASVRISVENRIIKVEGTDRYSIYDNAGIQMPVGTALTPGVYFVSAMGVSYKVLVK